ncbi:PadR family transcriptional regulator [Actinokineospora soli]|uniref:PadR family transcriptional regulator n=1 Tax=Actinokineospora soli TaxID=1048753 RepID=A0ABW2TSV5_9PSEU
MRTRHFRRGPWAVRPDLHDHEFPEDHVTPPFPLPAGPARAAAAVRHVRPGPPRPHGRKRRGDVRAAVLALLTDRPMHGYEMIQEIAARSGGAWKPSPGSVYPTLQLLADEGLVRGVDGEGGKRLFELTDTGREAASALGDTPPWEHAAAGVDPTDRALREALAGLATAVMGVAQAASGDQKSRAVDVLDQARRQLYAILGEDTPR